MSDSNPTESLAEQTSDLLRRVGLDPTEMSGMLDTLGGLVGAEGAGPRITLAEPVYAVTPTDEDRWMVIRLEDGADHVIAHLVAKSSAVVLARRHASEEGGTLVVHRVDGSVQSTYHYDHEPLPPAEDGDVLDLSSYRSS